MSTRPRSSTRATSFRCTKAARCNGCWPNLDAQLARYQQLNRPTSDLYTDAAQSELAYLSKAVKLLTDDTPRDPYVTVPVARVRRTPTGGFELDEDFIPSCAHIDASPT
ncbi:type VI secretion system baseplate subunit TssK, partial [Xanthomonas oryzae]